MSGRYCEACKTEPGEVHITITVDMFAAKTTKQKVVQFWLCKNCSLAVGKVMSKDYEQKARVANLITTLPKREAVAA